MNNLKKKKQYQQKIHTFAQIDIDIVALIQKTYLQKICKKGANTVIGEFTPIGEVTGLLNATKLYHEW